MKKVVEEKIIPLKNYDQKIIFSEITKVFDHFIKRSEQLYEEWDKMNAHIDLITEPDDSSRYNYLKRKLDLMKIGRYYHGVLTEVTERITETRLDDLKQVHGFPWMVIKDQFIRQQFYESSKQCFEIELSELYRRIDRFYDSLNEQLKSSSKPATAFLFVVLHLYL